MTLFFQELQNIQKREERRDSCTKNLPLFIVALMSKQVSDQLQIFSVNSFEIGNATAPIRPFFSLVVNSFHTHPFSQEN